MASKCVSWFYFYVEERRVEERRGTMLKDSLFTWRMEVYKVRYNKTYFKGPLQFEDETIPCMEIV